MTVTTKENQVSLSEFLQLIDCSIVPVYNLKKNYPTYKSLIDRLNMSDDTDCLEEEHEDYLINNKVYLIVDDQLGRVKGAMKDIDVPFIIDCLSTFIDDTFYNGVVDKTVNRDGVDIELPDTTYTTLLNYLDKNNKNEEICSKYIHDVIRAIVIPDFFDIDLSIKMFHFFNDEQYNITLQEHENLFMVTIENEFDKSSFLMDNSGNIQNVIDCDLDIDVIENVKDFIVTNIL